MDYNGFDIEWDGRGSLRVTDDGFTVAVDPVGNISPEFKASIVLLTHADTGHFDPEKLEQVCGEKTCIVIPESMSEEDIPCKDVEILSEGEQVDIFGVSIEGVPMYNESHARGEGLGYCFVMRDSSFFVAGDTGLIEEFFDLENRVDLAFLPIDGEYTMDMDEAVQAAVRIKPRVVVPYHYGEKFYRNRGLDLKALRAELEDRNIGCQIIDK